MKNLENWKEDSLFDYSPHPKGSREDDIYRTGSGFAIEIVNDYILPRLLIAQTTEMIEKLEKIDQVYFEMGSRSGRKALQALIEELKTPLLPSPDNQ